MFRRYVFIRGNNYEYINNKTEAGCHAHGRLRTWACGRWCSACPRRRGHGTRISYAKFKMKSGTMSESEMKSGKQQLNRSDQKKCGRRDFLFGLGRIACLGAVVITGFVLKKRKADGLDSDRCPNRFQCRACVIFTDCKLPAALTARREAERK
jgi:hypothetical protein